MLVANPGSKAFIHEGYVQHEWAPENLRAHAKKMEQEAKAQAKAQRERDENRKMARDTLRFLAQHSENHAVRLDAALQLKAF
jgi:hypothetical protein